MTEILKKNPKVVDNTQWRERHQFVLSANGNIICQRYFKVNGFNPNSLQSAELLYTFFNAVELIKKDLVSKSRIYTAITMGNTMKLTGFHTGEYTDGGANKISNDACLVCNDNVRGEVELSDGMVLNKEYIDYEPHKEEADETPFVLKFTYLFDDKPLFEDVWDGTIYPKYVRNCIDLSNSNASYKYVDPMRMSFSQQMAKSLNEGRKDLIYTIIKMFCDTLSNNVDENGNSVEKKYFKTFHYAGKDFYCTTYPRDTVRGWANAVRKKTIAYNRWVNLDMSQSKIDYINNRL